MADRCDVVEQRYVVNNLRFDLGEDEDENPYVMTRKEYKAHQRRRSSVANPPSPIEERANGANGPRSSTARKGSMSWKASKHPPRERAQALQLASRRAACTYYWRRHIRHRRCLVHGRCVGER